jgi:hypothetical protein
VTTARTLQQRMTQGELDPKMLGRSDLDQYYGAAETMENVVALPQGGFKRRGGLEHIQKILRQITITSPTVSAPNGGTTGNLTDQNTATSFTTTTNISTTNPYVVAQYDLGSSQSLAVVYIYGLALSSGSSSEFFIQGSTDASAWTNVGGALSLTTTAKNYSRRVDNSYRYIRLARIGSTNLGTATVTLTGMDLFTSGALSATKHFKFEFSSDQSYQLLATDKNIAVYKDGVFQIDLYLADLTSARLADVSYAASADTLIIFHEDVQTYRVQRAGADDVWTVARVPFENIPYYAPTQTSTTGAALGWGTLKPNATTGTTHIDVSSGSLNSTHVNQYVEGNGGRARILSVQSSTKANIFIEIPFYNTDSIAAANWELITGYEATWSVTRGWPICGTFHEGRLWIGGSKSRPSTIWGSRVGIYYDFDIGTALDDEAIEASLETDQLNRITNMYSGRNLMVFTTGAEFVLPQSLNEPITPANISTSRQSSVGSTRGLGVFEIEGGVFYCQNGGQSVQEFIFNDTQNAYSNNIISLLSGHLVKNPVDFTLRRATSLDDGALLVQVLSNGEATIATIQRSQGIGAFTRQTTDGTFKSCGVDYNDIYFVVERTINGSTERYLERLNEDHLLDASTRFTTGLPTATFTNLYQVEAKECRVVADGAVLNNVTPSGGSVTIDRNAEDYCEIGLWFAPIFTDLPVELPGQSTLIGKRLNISEIVLRFHETVSCKINNKTVQFRQFGGDLLDVAPTPFSGIKRMQGWRGWTETGQVTITQDAPTPLTVLALSKRITFDG